MADSDAPSPGRTSDAADPKRYKKTLNLPRTAFPMRANLVQNEPASIKRWARLDVYRRLQEARHREELFSFHDGPPYANGSIHMGHLLNKVLKDLVVRSRQMLGYRTPYIPGWDCHGLPIEHKVMQELGDRARDMDRQAVRRKCRDYAAKFVKQQSGQMQRLLTLADYDQPYLTMDPAYEAAVLEVFADLVDRGLVYRDLKPVHWSIANQTALAEAELEYEDREDTSVYVFMDVEPESYERLPDRLADPELAFDGPVSLMIWTTTPWTLPANLAIAVGPGYEYGLYKLEHRDQPRYVIVAADMAGKLFADAGVAEYHELGRCTGAELAEAEITYNHPFLDDGRTRPIVTADYVTLTDGCGLVHTAPGHGKEDYDTGKRVGLEIYCPVRADGTFDHTAPRWLQAEGVDVFKANDRVVEELDRTGHLFRSNRFTHSYPHDWRSKTPVIFRATEQWFVAVDKPYVVDEQLEEATGHGTLRHRAMDVTAEAVRFFPEWGRNRMRGMIESRPDWCLSRQRAWGLPIPAFFSASEGHLAEGERSYLLTRASILAVAKVIAEKGSDVWFAAEADVLLAEYDPASDPDAPHWLKQAGRDAVHRLVKSDDIFDVWFESGSSWHAAIRSRLGDEAYPTDLYLEGSDQHRGWFQLSLLPALGATGAAPFKAVLTHGFMVDKHGRKMSKSGGNALNVDDLMKDFGADVCRWWVSTLATEGDIKTDLDFLREAGESYRKIRNTLRYLLSCLNDFEPHLDARALTADDATSLDAWVLDELMQLVDEVRRGYAGFQYRRVSEALFNFCNDTVSAVYASAVKDRLYCDPTGSDRRRRAQTAIRQLADALIRMLAPILPHTADEAWLALHQDKPDSDRCVHLELLPEPVEVVVDPDWAGVMAARQTWMRAIEQFRQGRDVDNPLDLGLRITPGPEQGWLARFDAVDLADVCGVSRFECAEPADAPAVEVLDLRDQPRCERSWKRDGTVRERSDGGLLSDRDAEAVGV